MAATSPISSAPVDPYVRRVAAVCDMHQVPLGSPAELPGFLVALDQDKHLAMDFWAVVAKMDADPGVHTPGGPTLNARILEVVVEAVTRRSVAEIIATGEEPRRVVGQLASLLAGEDINSPMLVESPVVEAPDVEAKKPSGRAEVAPVSTAPPSTGPASSSPFRAARAGTGEPDRTLVEMRPLRRAEDRISAVPPDPERLGTDAGRARLGERASDKESVPPAKFRWSSLLEEVEPLPSGPQAVPAKHALVDAPPPPIPEISANEAELALAKLRLMQWALENFPSAKGGTASSAERDLLEAKVREAELLVRYSALRQAVAERESAVKAPVVQARMVEAPAAITPVEDVAPAAEVAATVAVPDPVVEILAKPTAIRSADRSLLPVAVGEVLPKAELAIQEPSDDGEMVHIPLSEYEDPGIDKRAFIIGLSIVVAAGMVLGLLLAWGHGSGLHNLVASIHERYYDLTHHTRSSLYTENDLVVDPVPDPTPPAPVPMHRVPVAPKRPITPKFGDRPLIHILPAPSDRIEPAPGAALQSQPAGRGSSDAASSARSGAVSGGPVLVPGSVMDANLLVSRIPTYPQAARENHIEGRVVMQAVVTKEGTVGHVLVIEGDSALRAAAVDAVSKWRYRPYTVNGVPVDVSTTVTVNFILN